MATQLPKKEPVRPEVSGKYVLSSDKNIDGLYLFFFSVSSVNSVVKDFFLCASAALREMKKFHLCVKTYASPRRTVVTRE